MCTHVQVYAAQRARCRLTILHNSYCKPLPAPTPTPYPRIYGAFFVAVTWLATALVKDFGQSPPIALTITILSLISNSIGLGLTGWAFDSGVPAIRLYAATVFIGATSGFGLYYWCERPRAAACPDDGQWAVLPAWGLPAWGLPAWTSCSRMGGFLAPLPTNAANLRSPHLSLCACRRVGTGNIVGLWLAPSLIHLPIGVAMASVALPLTRIYNPLERTTGFSVRAFLGGRGSSM